MDTFDVCLRIDGGIHTTFLEHDKTGNDRRRALSSLRRLHFTILATHRRIPRRQGQHSSPTSLPYPQRRGLQGRVAGAECRQSVCQGVLRSRTSSVPALARIHVEMAAELAAAIGFLNVTLVRWPSEAQALIKPERNQARCRAATPRMQPSVASHIAA